MSPKWGFGVAMFPVGVLYFCEAYVGHGASRVSTLVASLLLCILQRFRAQEGMLPRGAFS